MATVSDITITPLSGLNHIDALLDKGPDWNYLSNGGANVLLYTFSISSGNETGRTGQEAFTAAQMANTRSAFNYLQQLTGIEFRETTNGAGAQIHLANIDISGQYTTGLLSWQAGYRHAGETLTEYTANAYLYLDNAEWRSMTQNLNPGTQGYETLLHELGHALGLKHPFTDGEAGAIVLPNSENNTSNTLMSYDTVGGWYSTYRPYDVAALNWLYGGDGLRGALGLNSSGGRYITGTAKSETLVGTALNDIFQGNGGDDMINGGQGRDTTIFSGRYSDYRFNNLADGNLAVAGAAGVTTLQDVEVLQFSDMSVERADIAVDTVAPVAPVLAVTKNGSHYSTTGSVLALNGSAEANAVVKIYIRDELIATATAGDDGLWSTTSLALKDGFNYQAYATATDAAGNVSVASNPVLFHVDSVAPSVPTLRAALDAGGNRPVFTGTGEAGTTIELYRLSDFTEIGSAKVGADGKWTLNSQPLPNGEYSVRAVSVDDAGNARSGSDDNVVSITINHEGYQAGTANADSIAMNPGSHAVDAGAGLDTVVFSGDRAGYTVRAETWGFSATAANGDVTGLFNVERIKFDDMMVALDINGSAGQIYRLYQAAFDRVPDVAGLAFWVNRTDQGDSLMQIAQYFALNKEYIDLYANTSNEEFVNELYQHVLGRDGEGAGLAFWTGHLNTGATNRDEVLTAFSESPENQAQVIGTIVNGIDYPFPVA